MRCSLNILIFLSFLGTSFLHAQNPIIQTSYTADPAPMVYNDKVYLYTSHDEDNSTWFTMDDWRLYTTDDMVNWTDHGAILEYTDFEWAKQNAWAPAAIEKDGKFYLYVPITDRNNQNGIGVAVSHSPYGPFIDPLGEPLISNSNADIDPNVFIDEDGQAYMFWGNPVCYYVKLDEDMISIEGEIKQIPNTFEAFGEREGEKNERRPTTYEEGPWIYKRNDIYYLLFAAGPIPEHIGYATSKSINGPWNYQGKLMPTEGGSFTNHPAIIDYKGNTYFFYHNAALPGGSGFTRSVCVQQVRFNEDGTIEQMQMTNNIAHGLKDLNPYRKTEAETIAWSEGMKAKSNDIVGNFITAQRNEAYLKVNQVDFGNISPKAITVRVGTTHHKDIVIEVRVDNVKGKLLAQLDIPLTGGDDRWELVSKAVEKIEGIHDLYFIVKGEVEVDLMYFDYWMFSK